MSQYPRWARKQTLEHKLKDTLNNPYADQADVQAAREAVNRTLDQQDRDYQRSQENRTQHYLKKLGNHDQPR